MASHMFGWDSTFKVVEKSVKRKSDVIIAFVHWNLTRRGFLVIDTGEEQTLPSGEVGSEVLPENWNSNDKYTLRYVYKDKLYILHALETEGCLIINLMRPSDISVSNVAVKPDETVAVTNGTIGQMIPTYKDLMHNLKTNLIDLVADKPTTTMETQTTQVTNPELASSQPTPNPYLPQADTPPRAWADLRDPLGVGEADLNPLAPGGGMLFDPFGPARGMRFDDPGIGIPGGLPRGAVPPGARFDPFGPPGGGPAPNRRRPPPDADHFPPPGADDMFM